MDERPTQQAQLRRYQDTLIIVGNGVIAFGSWTLAKVALLLVLFNDQGIFETLQTESAIYAIAAFIVAIFASCLDLPIRLFVGLSARAEGHGKKKSVFYLVVAGFIATANIVSIIVTVFGLTISRSLLDAAVSLVIDATSLATLILMIRCSVRLRQLSRQTE